MRASGWQEPLFPKNKNSVTNIRLGEKLTLSDLWAETDWPKIVSNTMTATKVS